MGARLFALCSFDDDDTEEEEEDDDDDNNKNDDDDYDCDDEDDVNNDDDVKDSENDDDNVNTTCLFVGCLTSQQHASVSQGRICSDNFTCCHTEIEAADQTFHLTQSQYTDTGPTSPSADPITPGAWQGSHWSANV